MGVQTLHDTGDSYTILSKYDGGVYAVAAPDCVIEGVGDEFTINYQADSLNVTFNAGSEAIIGGSFFKLTSLEAVTLVSNSQIYLCANIDLSRPNGQTGQFVQRTSSNMQDDNLNGSGTSRDLLLYVVTTGASGVISVVDKRKILSSSNMTKTELVDLIYPVNSIYMSVGSTSPATLFGGTWEQLKDKFLLCAGTTYAAGSTGGEATHTLTVQEMPSHSHTTKWSYPYLGSGTIYGSRDSGLNTYEDIGNEINNTGGGQPHNNMPPYLAVYVWKRIA